MNETGSLVIAICDDEPEHLELIRACVDSCLPDVRHQIHTYKSSNTFLNELPDLRVSLAILDINLKDSNGIELAALLHQAAPHCKVIFISGTLSYAQDVYDVEHYAYVQKSDMDIYLPRAINRLVRERAAVAEDLMIVSAGRRYFLDPSHIIYMERDSRRTYVHMDNNVFTDPIYTSEKIEDIASRLDPKNFIQCHKSYVINWNYVTAYTRKSITLKNGTILPVSRQKSTGVLDSYNKWNE